MSPIPADNPFRATALVKYRRCGRAWYYTYRLGMKEHTSPYAAIGKCCHAAAAAAFRAVLSGDELPGLGYWQEVFANIMEDMLGEVDWSYMEPAEATKRGYAMMRHYLDKGIPQRIRPRLVEQPVQVCDSLFRVALTGTLDLITTDDVLVDLKFRGRVKGDELKLQNDFQLHWYAAMAVLSNLGPIKAVAWHEATMRTAKVIQGEPNTNQAYSDMKTAVMGIAKGLFMRAPGDDYLCCPKWCYHWDICHTEPWYDPLKTGLEEPGIAALEKALKETKEEE